MQVPATKTFRNKPHREKLFSAHSAESNFSFSETKFRYKYSRWMSADPAVGDYMAGSDVGGGIYNLANFNIYHYGGNNPLRYTDPTGAFDFDEGAAPYEIPINVSNEGKAATMPFALGPQSPAQTGDGPRFLGGLPSNIKPLSFADDFKDYTGQNLDEFLEKFNKSHPDDPITAKQLKKLFKSPIYAMFALLKHKSWHTDLRDELNKLVPQNLDELYQRWGEDYPDVGEGASKFHDYRHNLKFIDKWGHLEGVYNRMTGVLNSDPRYKGTFNFFNFKRRPLAHLFADIIPYLKWGN